MAVSWLIEYFAIQVHCEGENVSVKDTILSVKKSPMLVFLQGSMTHLQAFQISLRFLLQVGFDVYTLKVLQLKHFKDNMEYLQHD